MTQMDYKYSLLGSTVDDYHKRPLLLQVDNTPMNLFAVLEVKRDLTRRSSTVGCKIRLYGFLFVLAIMFLIMASYVLTGDKKGLLLTPSPYHLNGLVSPGPFAFNLTSVGDYAHIKLVVKSIKSKVEFRTQRQCPDRKALMRSDPHVSIIRLSEGLHDRYPVEDYLDLFDQAAYQIQGELNANTSGSPSHPNVIIGEASASTMWDNNAWVYFYDNTTEGEPPFLIQDFIHALQPEARFIVMLRDPVERLYSDYLYFGIANKSAEDFHEKVSESLQLFEGCLMEYTMRSCVYNTTVNNAMPVRLQVGLYVVYLIDWLAVFSREQILVLRLEDHAFDMKDTLHKVFDFLNLGPLSKEIESQITRSPASNTRRPADKNLGPMLPITKEILQDFYKPFNEKLAKVLQKESFRWENNFEL
ncbi:carbohydrate sulfotransferase 15 [Poecilia latipinna]|uniref:carbohydrate sulfotransferase 15 n=1 Tax=Poecilia latipinna TaxID=48699 RepID=UPI00072E1CE4|nr:PREDICTED: carbohydrate sulfotransferase 15 [Poecilia latipinna]